MKVLQINATYGYGSTGLIVKDIGDALAQNGDEAYFAYQSCTKSPDGGYRVGSTADRKLHALLCRLTGKQAYFSRRATKKLIRHIAAVRPDVVHLHNLHSNYIHLNMLLKHLAKEDIATVITMHDCWYFTGKCFHYVDAGCTRFQTGCGKCPKKSTPPKSLFFDPSAKVLRDRCRFLPAIPRITLVGCSQWICNEAKKSRLSSLPIVQVYNGVDTEIFRPEDVSAWKAQLCPAGERLVMGMANKWFLLSNLSMIQKVSELPNTKLMLVGCTEEQKKLLAEEYPTVLGVGFIKDREELARHYNVADVFVNLTHADTLPTVNMESICSGTPVITYDSCGSPELVLDGCGEVVAENDATALLDAVAHQDAKIAQEALARARATFDKNECYKMYIRVYKEALAEKETKE